VSNFLSLLVVPSEKRIKEPETASCSRTALSFRRVDGYGL
jgi:hypothetical protein